MGHLIDNWDDYDYLEEYDPSPFLKDGKRKRKDAPIHYVHESEMWEDMMTLYKTGEFPERLAKSLLLMVNNAVDGWKRFRDYDDVVRENMKSRAVAKVCTQLMLHKFDPKHGSKVYSWCIRVIINECLQEIKKENKRRRALLEVGELALAEGTIEIVQPEQ